LAEKFVSQRGRQSNKSNAVLNFIQIEYNVNMISKCILMLIVA